jgi:hypothetical protein
MEGALSKARRIWQLMQAGKKAKEIAAIVDCNPAYVRVVRQRGLNPERTRVLQGAYKRRRLSRQCRISRAGQGGSRSRKKSRAVTRPYRWQAQNVRTMRRLTGTAATLIRAEAAA